MKLGVLSYPRTASTLLVMTLAKYLRERHDFESWQILSECFNPSTEQWLVEVDGHLQRIPLPPGAVTQPQTRDDRLALMWKYKHQDYVIKVQGQDFQHLGVPYFLHDAGYEFLTIERRNPLDAIFSSLVAWEHDYWNDYDGGTKTKPEYHEFEADMELVKFVSAAILSFQRAKEQMPVKASFYFEDIVSMSRRDILKAAGFETEEDDTPPATRKLLGAGNAALITNIDEVRGYYEAAVVPHLNT